MKPPPLFVVLYVDTDGKTRIADTWYDRDNATWARKQWQKRERAGRRYRVVRYVPAGGGK